MWQHLSALQRSDMMFQAAYGFLNGLTTTMILQNMCAQSKRKTVDEDIPAYMCRTRGVRLGERTAASASIDLNVRDAKHIFA